MWLGASVPVRVSGKVVPSQSSGQVLLTPCPCALKLGVWANAAAPAANDRVSATAATHSIVFLTTNLLSLWSGAGEERAPPSDEGQHTGRCLQAHPHNANLLPLFSGVRGREILGSSRNKLPQSDALRAHRTGAKRDFVRNCEPLASFMARGRGK